MYLGNPGAQLNLQSTYVIIDCYFTVVTSIKVFIEICK